MTLRDIRQDALLTQEDVAKICNVTQAAVSRWESGEYPIPRKYWKYYRSNFRLTDDEINDAINETMHIGG